MGTCASRSSEEQELAAQVLGAAKARNMHAVRRLSAFGVDEGKVWVTRQTSDIRKEFKFGPQINKGQFGRICVVYNAAGEKFACKQISKRKLTGTTSIRDIRREIEMMHHLRGHPNVISFHGAYEDENDVYLVMELCTGGDLFERIASAATITERSAAAMFRELVSTVVYCHSLGVLHRDLKPENFLITDHSPDARIKLADFGLSCFFAEGQQFEEVVGSAYYMAPEVIEREYGKECDVWSLGIILHILLSGSPPFTGSSDADILKAVRTQEVDLTAKPWPSVSRHARHLVGKMLEKDPQQRIRLDQVLTHPWLRVDGTAPPRALQGAVRDRIDQFRALNVFKREARRVLASVLAPEEVSGLKLLFEELDTDRDGVLSLEELRKGLAMKGEELQGDEALALLKAADLNCDGAIDYREFVAATCTLSRMQQSDVMVKAFRHFDLDGDGYITREELAFVLSELPAPVRAAAGTAGATAIAQLMNEADLDRDGRVDYQEFCAMMLEGAGGLEGAGAGSTAVAAATAPAMSRPVAVVLAAPGGLAPEAPGDADEVPGPSPASLTVLQVVQAADLPNFVDEVRQEQAAPSAGSAKRSDRAATASGITCTLPSGSSVSLSTTTAAGLISSGNSFRNLTEGSSSVRGYIEKPLPMSTAGHPTLPQTPPGHIPPPLPDSGSTSQAARRSSATIPQPPSAASSTHSLGSGARVGSPLGSAPSAGGPQGSALRISGSQVSSPLVGTGRRNTTPQLTLGGPGVAANRLSATVLASGGRRDSGSLRSYASAQHPQLPSATGRTSGLGPGSAAGPGWSAVAPPVPPSLLLDRAEERPDIGDDDDDEAIVVGAPSLPVPMPAVMAARSSTRSLAGYVSGSGHRGGAPGGRGGGGESGAFSVPTGRLGQ